MKKAIACLLALPLALAACGAQGADSAQSQPATETEQTTETAQKTTAPAVGTAGKLRGTAYMLYTNTGLYSMNQKYDEATNTDTFYLIKNRLRHRHAAKAGGDRAARRRSLWHGRLGRHSRAVLL